MKYKLIISLIVVWVSVHPSLGANTEADSVIFHAMQDELDRNCKHLSLPGYGKPFYLSYNMAVDFRYELTASLGSITNSYILPKAATGDVRLLIGNHHRTNDIVYDGKGLSLSLPLEADYNEIRHNFWLATDIAYKNALRQYVSKMSYLKANPKLPEDEKTDDFPEQKTTNYLSVSSASAFDKQRWEKQMVRLSAIFLKYKRLMNTQVAVFGNESGVWKVASDGLKFKETVSRSTLLAVASVITADGVKITDSWSMTLDTPGNFPPPEILEQKITEFAESLIRLAELSPMDEYYSGPVLFEEAACAGIFIDNLLQPGKLTAYRSPEGKTAGLTFDSRMERKVLDNRLSVKNYTCLKNYNGAPLYGLYKVDAEGIEPSDEMLLIESGVLRRQLCGRIPTAKSPCPTGSSRLVSNNGLAYFVTSPGVVRIEVKNGLKNEKMRKALLKAAAEENLDYAYIVRRIAGQASRIYKVDVKTGTEIQVRAGEFGEINLAKLKRLHEISAKESVTTYLYDRQVLSSLIYPSAILMEDVEINVPKIQKEKASPVIFPLQR